MSWPTETSDPGLRLWNLARPLLPVLKGHVLEVGYRDTAWASYAVSAVPGLSVTAIDWREAMPAVPGVTVIRGDVLAQDWPQTFDAVVGLSSFEHVGLGHYELDPLDEDGDVHLVEKVRAWLKPGGWCYFDVPYDPRGFRLDGTKYRAYDTNALTSRFGPVEILGYTTSSVEGWIPQPERPPTKGKSYYYVACLIRT